MGEKFLCISTANSKIKRETYFFQYVMEKPFTGTSKSKNLSGRAEDVKPTQVANESTQSRLTKLVE